MRAAASRGPVASYYRLGVGRRTSKPRRRRAAPRPCASARREPTRGNRPATRRRRSRVDPAPRPRPERLRTVHETSPAAWSSTVSTGARLAGRRSDRPHRSAWADVVVAAQGHIELGETAEQTAIREVAEETGIPRQRPGRPGAHRLLVVTDGCRVHKTVHHYLMRFSGGELSSEDLEVAEVAWVPLPDLPSRLAYADERRLAEVADALIDKLQSDGPAALPPLRRAHPGDGRRRIHAPGIPTNRHRAGRTATARAVSAPRFSWGGVLRLAAVVASWRDPPCSPDQPRRTRPPASPRDTLVRVPHDQDPRRGQPSDPPSPSPER